MSAAHDDHAHAFDGEPIRVLPSDEPRTPLWLPAVGVALFTLAAIWMFAGEGGGARPREPVVVEKPAAAAPPAPRPSVAAVPPRLPEGQRPTTAPKTTQNVQDLQKRIEELRQKRAADGQPAPTAAPKAP